MEVHMLAIDNGVQFPQSANEVQISLTIHFELYGWTANVTVTVGLGSWCFHMTLKYEMQHTPSIKAGLYRYICGQVYTRALHRRSCTTVAHLVTTRCAVGRAFAHQHNYSTSVRAVGLGSWCFHMTLKYEMQVSTNQQMRITLCRYECFKHKNSVNYPLLFVLITFSVIVSMIYLNLKEPVFHQIVYGALVSVIVLRSVYIVLWGLREKMPPVVGAVTQFHAWWHIFTGLGSYLHILLSGGHGIATFSSVLPSELDIKGSNRRASCNRRTFLEVELEHLPEAEAPQKTRKEGTDAEPSALPMSASHPPVSAGKDVVAPEGSVSPSRETLPSETLEEVPSVLTLPEAPLNPEATIGAGAIGENPGATERVLSSMFEEIEALDLTLVAQGEDDFLPANLDLGDITPPSFPHAPSPYLLLLLSPLKSP
ncbi:Alkaline ceramidase 3 [Chelonia mydas]|uniref:ceramidase n=1 Tax=Chelonia mydas TaxID=8469 RepID=M7B8I8_CHEMY|nr:Alkaline ceramidase 3 [Chelonia mydas]